MLPTFIFDLDDTVIDSTHRQRVNSDGSIDLAHWRRFNTASMIAKDRPLPLARSMVEAIASGLDVVVITSRVIGKADINWLKRHNMMPRALYSRAIDDERPTGQFKLTKMAELAIDRGTSFAQLKRRVILWDDCKNVQSVLKNAGFRVIDPVQYNLTYKDAV